MTQPFFLIWRNLWIWMCHYILEKIKMQCKALVFLIFGYFMTITLKPCSHQMNDVFVVPFPDGDHSLPDCWRSKSQTSDRCKAAIGWQYSRHICHAVSGPKMFKIKALFTSDVCFCEFCHMVCGRWSLATRLLAKSQTSDKVQGSCKMTVQQTCMPCSIWPKNVPD